MPEKTVWDLLLYIRSKSHCRGHNGIEVTKGRGALPPSLLQAEDEQDYDLFSVDRPLTNSQSLRCQNIRKKQTQNNAVLIISVSRDNLDKRESQRGGGGGLKEVRDTPWALI